MHLTESDFGVLLDPSAGTVRRMPLVDHVSCCQACRTQLDELESTIQLLDEVFPSLDHPAPRVAMLPFRRIRQQWPVSRIAAVAGLAAATAALAAAATTGALSHLVARVEVPWARHRVTQTAASRGIEVPVNSAVAVDITARQLRGSVRVSMGTQGVLIIRASADGPRYHVRSGHVIVENSPMDSASYDILVPPPPTPVSVRVAGRVVFAR